MLLHICADHWPAITLVKNNIFSWDHKHFINIGLLLQKQSKSRFLKNLNEDPPLPPFNQTSSAVKMREVNIPLLKWMRLFHLPTPRERVRCRWNAARLTVVLSHSPEKRFGEEGSHSQDGTEELQIKVGTKWDTPSRCDWGVTNQDGTEELQIKMGLRDYKSRWGLSESHP